MTLNEWSNMTDIPVDDHPSTHVVLHHQHAAARADLYHLSDYKVSSVSGSTIWLTPINQKTPNPYQTAIDAQNAEPALLTIIFERKADIPDEVTFGGVLWTLDEIEPTCANWFFAHYFNKGTNATAVTSEGGAS